MARLRAPGAALMALALGGAAIARDIEITRSCFPGFCVESRHAFTAIHRDPAAGKYRLLFSREQAVLYVEAGPKLSFPKCGACTLETLPGERVARRKDSARLMGRLIGPFEACRGAVPFYVHVFVYLPDADPEAVTVERACEVKSPR